MSVLRRQHAVIPTAAAALPLHHHLCVFTQSLDISMGKYICNDMDARCHHHHRHHRTYKNVAKGRQTRKRDEKNSVWENLWLCVWEEMARVLFYVLRPFYILLPWSTEVAHYILTNATSTSNVGGHCTIFAAAAFAAIFGIWWTHYCFTPTNTRNDAM